MVSDVVVIEYLPKERGSGTETNPCYSERLITAILRRIRN